MARSPLHRSATILELDLTQPLVDPLPADPLGPLRHRGRRLLRPTLKALHEAAADPHVLGLVAKVGGPLSWSTMHELRRGLQPFLDARKPTVAWAETFPDGPLGTCAYVLYSSLAYAGLGALAGMAVLGSGAVLLVVERMRRNRPHRRSSQGPRSSHLQQPKEAT